jgi:hypothetical protein
MPADRARDSRAGDSRAGDSRAGDSRAGDSRAGDSRAGDSRTGRDRDREPAGRDRDAAGRARNARPRDALGRPLARGEAGEPVLPDDLQVTPEWALATAQQLLDDGRPFHAHEVLEAAWKAAEPAERDLWQGLAQLAVGLTHARRGNARGAATLLRRGRARLAPYQGTMPHGIDVTGVMAQASELAASAEDPAADLPPGELRLQLTAAPAG